MDFDKLYNLVKPKAIISACGGIMGNEEAPQMREINIRIEEWCCITLKPDGTYKLDVPFIRRSYK